MADPLDAASALAPVRADLRLAIGFARRGAATHPAEVAEAGGLRVRFPRGGQGCEGVMMNTGGGLVGGDRGSLDIRVGEGARAILSSATAERVYRSLGPSTELDIALSLASGSGLHWLPQETILFSGARLSRRIEVDLAPDAELLMAEALVFGRTAMGETMADGMLRDRWRVRRGGALVYAEALRLEGDIAARLARPAVANGGQAVATLLLVVPDAEARLDAVRRALADAPCEAGASAWNGQLVARFCARDSAALRSAVSSAVIAIRGAPMPRVW